MPKFTYLLNLSDGGYIEVRGDVKNLNKLTEEEKDIVAESSIHIFCKLFGIDRELIHKGGAVDD